MKLEHLADILLVVLAAQTQQHAGVMLCHHKLLERAPRRINFNARSAVLATDAFPQRVIAVQHYHFVRAAPQGMNFSGDKSSKRRKEKRRIRNVTELVPL